MARSYTHLTIKLLFGQARSCAYPGCGALPIFTDRGKHTVVAEIAHIRSESVDGPRHDPEYCGDINGPENLLLLCGTHHKPVDRHESTYKIDELVVWKLAQVADADGGTAISDEDALALVRITPEERKAVDQIARLGYRVERVAASAADELTRVELDRRHAIDQLQRQGGPIYSVDEDGNQTRLSIQLSASDERAFQSRATEVFDAQRPRVQTVVDDLGEEMAVLRMMDPLLGVLANKVVLSAQLVAEVFHSPEVLEQSIAQLQGSVRDLHEAARERF